MQRTHVFITGKVQGVWYRDNTIRTAVAHGLCGWVRNLEDGRVEAVFEGEVDAVEALVRWCHQGPELARVDAVERYDGEAPQGLKGFVKRATVALP